MRMAYEDLQLRREEDWGPQKTKKRFGMFMKD